MALRHGVTLRSDGRTKGLGYRKLAPVSNMMVHTGRVFRRYLETLPPAGQRAEALDLFAAVGAAGLLALVYNDGPTIPRTLFALVFTFFVPGRAIVTNWPRMARWSGVAMPIVFSLTVLTLLATTVLWAHLWRPLDLFQAEAWLSLAGLSLGIARRHRHSLTPSGKKVPSWSRTGTG
jgi:hypothetical protein